MKEITEALDAYLTTILNAEDRSPDLVFQFYGLSELVSKDQDRFPATINGREKVSLNDRYDLLTHHRVMSTDTQEDDEWSFGVDIAKRVRVTLRTVLSHKLDVGEDYRYTFANYFPEKLTIDGFQFIFLVPNGIIEDHEQVHDEEWPGTEALVYGKHRLPWNICAITSVVEFIRC